MMVSKITGDPVEIDDRLAKCLIELEETTGKPAALVLLTRWVEAAREVAQLKNEFELVLANLLTVETKLRSDLHPQ